MVGYADRDRCDDCFSLLRIPRVQEGSNPVAYTGFMPAEKAPAYLIGPRIAGMAANAWNRGSGTCVGHETTACVRDRRRRQLHRSEA